MNDTKIKVIYSTRCLGTVGTQSENDSFTSIDDAKTAPLPEGADFAFSKYPPAKPGALCCEPLKAVNRGANAAL
jgi:hypothetical protein